MLVGDAPLLVEDTSPDFHTELSANVLDAIHLVVQAMLMSVVEEKMETGQVRKTH